MNQRVCKALAVPVIAVMITLPAVGQFGIPGIPGLGGMGIPVYDAGASMERWQQLGKLIAQLSETIKIYQRVTQQYDHMEYQARRITNMASRYRSPQTLWKGMTAVDLSGKSGTWTRAVNERINAAGGWQRAVDEYLMYASMGKIPSSQQQRRMLEIAGIELTDGSAISAMDSIGGVRLSGPATEKALQDLEQDSLSDNKEIQTEAAQMNKSNAIALIQARELTNTNKLLIAAAEMALLRARAERAATAYAVNNDVAFRQDGRAAMTASFADASQSMTAYRIP